MWVGEWWIEPTLIKIMEIAAIQLFAIMATPALLKTRIIQGLFISSRPGQIEWLSEKEKYFFKLRGVALLAMYVASGLYGALIRLSG